MRNEFSRVIPRLFVTGFALFLFGTTFGMTPPGVLDPTFGNGGRVTDGPGQSWDLAVQSDGKIVIIIGETTLARYNENGTPDITFGTNGRVEAPVFISSIRIQPGNGKIVASGYVCPCYKWGPESFAVMRLNPNGGLDSSFGDNGTVLTSFNFHAWGFAAAIDSDGKIVVGGWTWTRIGEVARDNFALARYNSDGSLDSSFCSDGKVVTQVTPNGSTYGENLNEEIEAVVIQPDGKIVAIGGGFGYEASRFLAVRYNGNGSLDDTFGSDGKVISTLTGPYQGAALLQPDGKIVSAGRKIVRLNADGSFDSSFDGDGVVALPEIGFTKIVRQPDGKIVGMGYICPCPNYDFAFARFDTNGSLDNAFGGGDGIATVDFNNLEDFPEGGLAIDNKGRAVFSGHSGNPNSVSLARIILHSGAAAPFDYDADGKSDYSVWRPSNNTWYLSLSQTGSYVVQPWGLTNDTLTPADYDGDGKTDMAVYRPTEGNWYVIYSQTNSINAIQFGLNGDIPQPQDFDGDGKADFGVFRPTDGTWYLSLSQSGVYFVQRWGLNGDKPVAADYDGDGRAELAVWRPSEGRWYMDNLVTGGISQFNWGLNGDMPIVGDYSGDGRADHTVYRPSNQTWYRIHTDDFGIRERQWGLVNDIPSPGDFDGDGKLDLAVYRPSEGKWYVLGSTNAILSQSFGLNGDIPTESSYVY